MQNYHGIVSNGNNATMEASAMEAAAASQLGLDRLLKFGTSSSSGNGQPAVATVAASISDRADDLHWPLLAQSRGQLSSAQCFPFQPVTQRQVPFLHWPCSLHRESQRRSWQNSPAHPALGSEHSVLLLLAPIFVELAPK